MKLKILVQNLNFDPRHNIINEDFLIFCRYIFSFWVSFVHFRIYIFRSYDYLPYNKLNPTEDTLSSLSNDELLALLSHEEKLAAEENKHENKKLIQRRKQIRFQDNHRGHEATSRSDSRNYEDRIYRHHNSIIGK